MRSYTYDRTWQPYTEDHLPPTASTLGPPDPRWKAFGFALEEAGFYSLPAFFTCRTGPLELYSRSNIPGEYHFLATLLIGSTWIRVWIADMPNLLQFLREVEARPIPQKRSLEEDPWQKVLHDTDIQELISLAKQVLQKLNEGKNA